MDEIRCIMKQDIPVDPGIGSRFVEAPKEDIFEVFVNGEKADVSAMLIFLGGPNFGVRTQVAGNVPDLINTLKMTLRDHPQIRGLIMMAMLEMIQLVKERQPEDPHTN